MRKTGSNQEPADLRKRAERQLAVKLKTMTDALTDEKKLVHELHVYKIELEIQNEALHEARIIAEQARSVAEQAVERYTELFDFSPIAYFNLGSDSIIHQSNFQGSKLLGIDRSRIYGQYFIQYVSFEDQTVFRHFLDNVFSSEEVRHCEITLHIGGASYCVAIEAITDKCRQSCLVAVSDISERKRIERKLLESHALLRALARHSEAAREVERRRIAREVHDELGQQLMALRLNVNLLNLRFGKQKPMLQEAIHALLQQVDNTIQVTRNVSSALRPAVLDMGIVPSLEWLTQEFSRHTGIQCELQAVPSDILVQEEQAIALFRITQEALTNAARHSEATRLKITFVCEPDAYLLQVEDNGIGFDTRLPRKQQSYGLVGLHERALTVGGELAVSSAPGSGTVVRVRIPIA
jgi:PAS domain S-box-containing protein